jgi:leucyl aminopeptidase
MRIAFAARPSLHNGTVAVGMWAGRRPGTALAALDDGRRLSKMLKRLGFDGDEGEALTFAAPQPPLDRLVVLGMGKRKKLTPSRLRKLGGALLDELYDGCAERVTVALDLDAAGAAELAYGLRLKSYRPTRKYRTRLDEDDEPPPVLAEVTIATDDPAAAAGLYERYEQVAEGVFLARDLTDEPGNRLGPQDFAERAQALAALGVEVTVMDERQLAERSLNLLAAVGRGSVRPPRLVLLRWQGGKAGQKPLVLVGKGITFDSGGLSIKMEDDEMDAMKGDMAGAAAVLGALSAVAGRKAAANVCGVLALAENMPSGTAQRPGDVVRSFSGLTVEVVDTDAEGRLALADALAWAAATLDPAAIIDIATLTGTVEEVLGDHHTGLHCNDDALAARLLAAGKAEDEPLWRLPLSAGCDDDIKSEVADVKNAAWGDVPDNDDAARFLQRFVPEGLAWAHIDMAGKEWADDEDPFAPEGPTGFGVRLFDRLTGGRE